jgi:serine/threonine protein kinase
MSWLERCQLCERIGKGSFGKVYRAQLRAPCGGVDGDVECAVKVVNAKGAEAMRAVLREVAFLKQACVHPNVVAFLGVGAREPGGPMLLFLELCLCSLADVIKRQQRSAVLGGRALSELAVLAIAYCVADALDFIHTALNGVHRDVKPANILLSRTGVVKLTDFNVSAKLSVEAPACEQPIGTPQFMAPEQIVGPVYSHGVDMWALGVTVLELADGRVPHAGLDPLAAMFRIVVQPAPSLERSSERSSELQALAAALLVKAPEHRHSARELLGDACLLPVAPAEIRAHALCRVAWEQQTRELLAPAAAQTNGTAAPRAGVLSDIPPAAHATPPAVHKARAGVPAACDGGSQARETKRMRGSGTARSSRRTEEEEFEDVPGISFDTAPCFALKPADAPQSAWRAGRCDASEHHASAHQVSRQLSEESAADESTAGLSLGSSSDGFSTDGSSWPTQTARGTTRPQQYDAERASDKSGSDTLRADATPPAAPPPAAGVATPIPSEVDTASVPATSSAGALPVGLAMPVSKRQLFGAASYYARSKALVDALALFGRTTGSAAAPAQRSGLPELNLACNKIAIDETEARSGTVVWAGCGGALGEDGGYYSDSDELLHQSIVGPSCQTELK